MLSTSCLDVLKRDTLKHEENSVERREARTVVIRRYFAWATWRNWKRVDYTILSGHVLSSYKFIVTHSREPTYDNKFPWCRCTHTPDSAPREVETSHSTRLTRIGFDSLRSRLQSIRYRLHAPLRKRIPFRIDRKPSAVHACSLREFVEPVEESIL